MQVGRSLNNYDIELFVNKHLLHHLDLDLDLDSCYLKKRERR